MSIFARIDDGAVAELFIADSIVGLFHPALVWVDITDYDPQPQERWLAVETDGIWAFSPPPPY